MVPLDQRGVSDIVASTFMFILLIIAAVLIHGFMLNSLHAAADRQSELKVEHLKEALQRLTVDPYRIQALEAAAQQLVLTEPIVDNDYLSSWMRNTFEYLRPPDYGIQLKLTYIDNSWEIKCPNGGREGEEFISRGSVTVAKTGGEITSVEVEIKMFKIRP